MWKFIVVCTAVAGVFFAGMHVLGEESLTFTDVVGAGGLWWIFFTRICLLVYDEANRDVGLVLYGVGSMYGYAFSPLSYPMQAATMASAVIILGMSICGMFFARGYTDQAVT